jgi:hypothetical protein
LLFLSFCKGAYPAGVVIECITFICINRLHLLRLTSYCVIVIVHLHLLLT